MAVAWIVVEAAHECKVTRPEESAPASHVWLALAGLAVAVGQHSLPLLPVVACILLRPRTPALRRLGAGAALVVVLSCTHFVHPWLLRRAYDSLPGAHASMTGYFGTTHSSTDLAGTYAGGRPEGDTDDDDEVTPYEDARLLLLLRTGASLAAVLILSPVFALPRAFVPVTVAVALGATAFVLNLALFPFGARHGLWIHFVVPAAVVAAAIAWASRRWAAPETERASGPAA